MSIKVRAWNPKLKRMTYGADLHAAGLQVRPQDGTLAVLNMVEGEDVDEIVMLATGMTGRDRKEIWQGDIVKLQIGFDGSSTITRQIVWDRDGWKTRTLPKKCDCCGKASNHGLPSASRLNLRDWARLEVVGNIYENPEYHDPGVPG
jgi:uncharacterized phage protein (TIGR01671 family)